MAHHHSQQSIMAHVTKQHDPTCTVRTARGTSVGQGKGVSGQEQSVAAGG